MTKTRRTQLFFTPATDVPSPLLNLRYLTFKQPVPRRSRGNENFRAPGENSFFFFQVKLFTGSVSVLLTSTSLKITLLKLEEATRETEHRSAVHSAKKRLEYTIENYMRS